MDKNLKSKEDKIYTYIVLVVGIIITYIYFYVLRPGSANLRLLIRFDVFKVGVNTRFGNFFVNVFGTVNISV